MRRSSAAVAAVTAMLTVSACSGEDGEPTGLSTDPASTPSAPSEEPTSPPTEEPTGEATPSAEATPTESAEDVDPASDDAVIDAYLKAKDAYVAAYNPPDPENSELLEWWTGPALEATQNELRSLASEGHSEIIDYGLNPEIVINEQGTTAVVNDCYDVHVETVETEDDSHVEDASYVRNSDFTLAFRNNQWIIVNFKHLDAECTPGG